MRTTLAAFEERLRENRVANHRPFHGRLPEVGAVELGFLQIGGDQAAAVKHRIRGARGFQAGGGEVGVAEVGAHQPRQLQIRAHQPGFFQRGAGQITAIDPRAA